jgi:hypothetical protein
MSDQLVELKCRIARSQLATALDLFIRDRDLTSFDDRQNDAVLFGGWYDYMMVRKRVPIEVQIFQLWWYAVYEDKLSPWTDLDEIRQMFPKVRDEPRKEQKTTIAPGRREIPERQKIVGRSEDGSAPSRSLVMVTTSTCARGSGTQRWGHGGNTSVMPSLFAMVQTFFSF